MDHNQFKEHSSRIAKIEESFSRAEKIQKLSGVYGAPVFIPVINELRYCGKHLLTALKSESLEEININLMEAEDHCDRAKYDAYEITLIFLSDKVDKYYEVYKDADICTVISDWYNIVKLIHDIKNYFQNNNKIDLVKNGDSDLYEKFQQLVNVLEILDLAKPELDRKLKVLRDNIRRARFYIIVFSLLVPMVLFLLSMLF